MSDVVTVSSLRNELGALRDALGAESAVEQRDALKSEIIALFRAIDHEITELAALKDDVKGLVTLWKGLDAPAAAEGEVAAPPPTAASPTRADHLNASTYIERGWSLISLGDHSGAEAALHRALELAPGDPNAESLLGWAQMLQEKHDEALLAFQRVLMREPQNSLARINVGFICLKKKIFGEAIEHLSKAIRLDNDRKATLYAHYYLGLLYFEREMYDDAQIFLRKAIALGPNLIEAYYELGRSIWFAGDQDGAQQAWRDGASANKFNPWGKRCVELLQHVANGGEPPRSS
ncbi:MAG: tetratricopeptide repeat protein [Gemmatimonadaceae bacterium]